MAAVAVGDRVDVVPLGAGEVVEISPPGRGQVQLRVLLDDDREHGQTVTAVRWRGIWTLL